MSAKFATRIMALIAPLAFLSPTLTAQETDWLELKEGFEGKKMHAKVRRIELPDIGDSQHVTVSIPKNEIGTTDDISEVVVVGKREGKEELLPNISYKWTKDYENNNYGLIITLDKLQNLPIRVYLKSDLPLPEHQ